MALHSALGIRTFVGVAVFFLIVSSAQELDSRATEQFGSAEEVADRQPSVPAVARPSASNRRRAGGVIKYKKISVKQSLSGLETSGVFETPELGQNKTRRLKPKTSPRYTMIYKPSKKSTSLSEATGGQSSEVKVEEERPNKNHNYGTKTWQQAETVTEIIDSFIRPTKRNRVRVNNRPDTSTSAPARDINTITIDPLRPISRSRSSTTTTTVAPTTTSHFIRPTRRPPGWRNIEKNRQQQATNERESSVLISVDSASAVIPDVSSSPTTAGQLTVGTVFDKPSDVVHLEEESTIRNIAAKPDKITYYETGDPSVQNPAKETIPSTVRPRMHVPKKSAQLQNSEPIMLQTKEQREQQQQEGLRPEESEQQSSRVRQRPPQPETNPGHPETAEETRKRIEKYEAEKMKQLDRLRGNKSPGAIREEEEPNGRRIPSSNDKENSPPENSAPVRNRVEEPMDFMRVPPSNFGQRLPQSDARPVYFKFEPPENLETTRYIYNPASSPETHPNLNPNQELYRRPEVIYLTTPRPNVELYRRPEVVYSTTVPPSVNQEHYRRPEVIYNTSPRPNIIEEYRRPEPTYTTSRPIPNEDRRPEIIYHTVTPRPSEEKYIRRPDVIYTPPKHEYLPPSAYLGGQETYPRVRIVYPSVPPMIRPPPVTYEPPHLEYMPPSPPPHPPRIYLPPVEEYKPPSSTVGVQIRRPEEDTLSVKYRQRLEDPRIIEGLRQLEAINSYSRLVSVGHPAVNELPYPPVREGQQSGGSSRPPQPAEQSVIRVTENPYEQAKRVTDQEIPFIRPGNYQSETTLVVGNPVPQANERPRGSYDGASFIVGKPYIPPREEATVKVEAQPFVSYDRPHSDPAFVNTGRRVPDAAPPASALEYPHHQPNQANPPNQHYQFQQPNQQVHEAHQQSLPNQSHQTNNQPYYQSYQSNQQFNEPHPHHQPQSVSERPYSAGYENVIPERPNQKPYGPPEGLITHSERPPQEVPYAQSEKPITVTVRPHGVPSPEPERAQVVHQQSSFASQQSAEAKPDLASSQNQQPIIQLQNQEQPVRPEVADHHIQRYQQHEQSSSKIPSIPSSFLPVGPVRAYQVTQAVYSQPPARFFQLPAPLPNPFENQFPSNPSPPSQVPQPPPPPPPPPPQPTTVPPPPSSNSFENHHLPSGDNWSVKPLFQNQYQFPTSRPFTSNIQPLLHPEEPHSSERHVHYRPATVYLESQRMNRSLSFNTPPYQQLQQQPPQTYEQQVVYERPIVIQETHQQPQPVYETRPVNIQETEQQQQHQPQLVYERPIIIHETVHQQQPAAVYERPIVIQETFHPQQSQVYERPVVVNQETVQQQQENVPIYPRHPVYNQPLIIREVYHRPQSEDSSNEDQSSDYTGVKGIPGVDYPILDSVPTNLHFKCDLVDSPVTRYPAYYADPYTRCQVFHVCQSNRAKDSFLCPNGTIFNQKVRVCDWWHNVQCEESAAFYNVNTEPENTYQQQQLLIF